jgi:predicted ArsR family transcriptional regulator
MRLSERQEKIVELVKNSSPMTGEQIASQLKLTRATLRPDLTILTMTGVLDARPRSVIFTGRPGTVTYCRKIETTPGR